MDVVFCVFSVVSVMVRGPVCGIYEDGGCYQCFLSVYVGVAEVERVQVDVRRRVEAQTAHSQLFSVGASGVVLNRIFCCWGAA